MMKAFSFLTILESLSKKLSILRTKMHSDDLRVDYESITSQLRVSRPFSRTSLSASLATSFADLSHRVSHFAAILTILFTVGVGNVFAQKYSSTPLVDLDFSSSLPEVSGVTYNKAEWSGGYISWSGNYSKGSRDVQIEFTTTGEGSFKLVIEHKTSGSNMKFQYTLDSGSALEITFDKSSTSDTYTINASAGRHTISLGAGGSSSRTVVSRITIYTEVPCDAANLTASNITSNGNQEAGTGITFSKVGTPASGDTWYWQTSATGTDKTYSASSSYTTATTAGSYTVYLRAYNSASDCWGTAASMTNTIYPAPSAMIHNTFAVDAAWSSTIATQDKINITNLNAMAAVGQSVGTGSNKAGLTQKIPSQSSEDPDKYMSLSFNVAAGKQLNVTSVVFDEQPITNTGTFKVSISDNQGSATKTQTIASGSAGAPHTLTLDGDIVGSFKGTVTVKVWAYGWSDGYRFGNYFYVNGTIEEALPTCTAPTNVAISGAWDKFGGETISLTATATGGSDNYTYQWQKYYGSTWNNITDNATATTANLVYENCDGSHSGTYRCVVSTGTDCSRASDGLQVKVYTLECYTNGTNIYHFTRNGNTQSGTLTLNLNANTAYKFKVHVDNDYYGNGGTINKDETNWVLGAELGTPDLTVNSGLGGTFTFTIDYSASGNSNTLGVPEISVTYPRKTIYLNPGVWSADGAKYAIYYFIDGHNAWSDLFVGDACGTYTTIPQWNGVTMVAVRLDSDATFGTWDKKWNQTRNITVTNNDYIAITGWGDGDSPYTYSTYTPATYSITFNGNGNTDGTMTNVTGITCGEDRTLAENGFIRTGYTFAGWATAADGEKVYDDKATISNITSNITLYAKWTVNRYTVTWNPAGGNWAGDTDNIVQTYEYGAEIQAPEKPSRTGYEFAEWDPTYDANETTMPANDVTYTAQWREIAQTYNITYNLGPEGWKGENPLATYTAGTEYTLPTDGNLTNENYGTFQGWYENNTFTGDAVTTIPADATGDKTYYAKWVYEIKFFEVVDEETDVVNKEFTNPLEGSYPTTYTYGIGITLPELPAKDGYTAAGWYSQWCVYYEETNGLGWVDACKSTALASDAYGNVNFAVKYTPTDDATDCPSSGTLYTAVAAATENISIAAGNTTDLELNVSTHKTTVTGGSMYVTSQQEKDKDLITSKGFAMTNNNTFFKISMDCELQEGDIISIEVGNDGANERGVWVSSATSRPKSQPECALTATNASLVPVTYTVTQSDEYNGKKVLYIYRATANSTYFNNINISRPVTCTTPTTAFANGSYTVGGSAVDLSTLISSKQGSGAITYTVKNANGTGATIAATSFAATSAGTATVTATQAADGDYCEKVMDATITVTATDEPEPDNCGISECGNATLTYTINASTSVTNTAANLISGTESSNTTALGISGTSVWSNITATDVGRAAAAANECFNPAPVMSSKITMHKGSSYNANTYLQFTFTVKSGYTFTPCDVQFIVQPVMTAANFRWVITNGTTEYGSGTANDVPVGQGNGATALLGLSSTSAMPAGTYYIRLYPYDNDDNSFRISNDVILKGTIEEVVCTTPDAPTAFAVGSITSNGATFTITDAANTNNYEIYYSTTSTAPTAETEATITTTEKTKAVTGLTATTTYYAWVRAVCNEENKSNWVALTDDSFTTSAEQTPGTCVTIFEAKATSKTAFSATTGTITSSNLSEGDELNKDGYSYAVKPNSSNALKIAPKAGETFKVGDKLTFVVYTAKDKEIGFVIGGNTYTQSVNKSLYYFEQELKETDITDGATSITFNRNSGDARWVEVKIERCATLPSCTTPVLSDLENKKVCPGSNVEWECTAENTAELADGETIAYQWNKKGNNTVLSNSATLTLENVTEATDGTYVVTATVSADGKASATATKEVTLTVLTAPTFNNFATTASVMKGNALAISDVEATNATGYAWYKSTDDSFDAAADTKVGTSKDLLLAAASIPEAADQTFYLFCVASNSCGSVTSNSIAVTVTPFISEECATAGNETNDHEFDFTNTKCSEATLDAKKVWSTNANDKYLTYTAKNGRYFKTAKVQVAHSSKTIAAYAYTTNGTDWTAVELTDLTTSLTTKEIRFQENVTGFRIGRKFDDEGEGSGNFYLYEACFTYENACTETTLTVGSYNNEYNITDGGEFTEPTFTLEADETTLEGQTLTYTSSNPAIATVDEDGNVEFEGMTGTVTITATFAGGEINKTEYCACQGSYTITVVCNDEAPKIIAAGEPNLNGCYNSITLEAKMQDGTTAFADGTFQWYRDGEAIEGATSASYEVVRAGTYTVSRTDACITMSSNSAVVTNENVEPEVERLTPFQYYHVNKDYSDQMKNRHLFAVTSYGTLNGKRYHLTATKNGETTLNLSSSNAFFTIPSSDNAVDTVMINLNELKYKYAEGDEIVITCAPINSCNNASAITASITIHVIGEKPTLALICSGADGEGTRATEELVVGGDFLTGYNKADLCQQTGAKTFDANKEWGFYTELKKEYIVTPVNGYAEFNKLNYEPFDILLLTDYPKSSKSEAAQKVIDDMAELCDYRPLLSFKTHFQSDKWKDANGQYKYTKWVKKGFTTAPVVPAQTATYVNIVCYAHPMFDDIDEGDDGEHSNYTFHDADDPNQLVYQMLTEGGYESVNGVKKGIQGFELAAADNFVTIGLVHYNATAAKITHTEGDETHTHVKWTAGDEDRLLVVMAERQTNIEARMMLFSLNAGAQSLQTEGGRLVILKCLEYLLQTDPLQVADCRFTFDNGEGAQGSEKWENGEKPHDYQGTGYQGDGLWSTAANWGPDYNVVPDRNNDVRIAAPCTVDAVKTKVLVGEEEQFADAYFPEVLSIHITKDGSLTIPANSSLTARSTILRADEDGNVYPTNVEDISLGSNAGGNASLILNNERGDTKAGVAMYSKAKADTDTYSEAASTWQYIGTPHSDVANAIYNYYDSWLYQYDTGTETEAEGWVVIPNGGPLVPFRGYCITHPEQGHTYWMEGTLAATTNQDITIPAGKFVVVANSWTAPIQIGSLADDDMEGLTDKTIYFFNTGSDPKGDNSVTQNATGEARWAADTYISVPIHAADYTGEDTNIPSMQGFYVVGGGADGTLHLDYERHVRAPRKNTPSGPMHAPARRVAADNEPQVAKFLFRGKRYDDRLIILERPDFTRGYDSGWDGEQWGGNAAAPMSYVVAETRYDAVSAIPEYEGTIIGFRAGEDSEYTIHFDYDGMEDALYLLDTDTQIYTRVLKGNSYTFTCADKAEHNRFILTRKAPQIATGTEHINTGENAKAVKFIKDDKIFIFVNGMLYDATGKMVIR